MSPQFEFATEWAELPDGRFLLRITPQFDAEPIVRVYETRQHLDWALARLTEHSEEPA